MPYLNLRHNYGGVFNNYNTGFLKLTEVTFLMLGFLCQALKLTFFNSPNPSSHTMALGSTEPLTGMSTRNLPGSKGRPARKADNLIAICEPPRPVTDIALPFTGITAQ
jgi:hypothetical protein